MKQHRWPDEIQHSRPLRQDAKYAELLDSMPHTESPFRIVRKVLYPEWYEQLQEYGDMPEGANFAFKEPQELRLSLVGLYDVLHMRKRYDLFKTIDPDELANRLRWKLPGFMTKPVTVNPDQVLRTRGNYNDGEKHIKYRVSFSHDKKFLEERYRATQVLDKVAGVKLPWPRREHITMSLGERTGPLSPDFYKMIGSLLPPKIYLGAVEVLPVENFYETVQAQDPTSPD